MKEKRYTLQEEQPTPIGWHPANEEEAAEVLLSSKCIIG